MLHMRLTPGAMEVLMPDSPALLSWLREEVDPTIPTGTAIIMLIDNAGDTARAMEAKLDGEPCTMGREPDVRDANGLEWIEYPYDQTKHGQEQTLTIDFRMPTGKRDKYVYRIRHGMRYLALIDPEGI